MEILKKKGFFQAMERADRLNRIGSFSVLVIGVPDGEDLDQPLGSAKAGDFDSMYFHPYNYDGTTIVEWDTDPASPRFGLPEKYQVQITRNNNTSQTKDVNTTAYVVHWSRVVHMAEGALDSSIEGESSLEACWNALIDKDKVRGSSSESYYRNSRQKLALETVNGAQLDKSEAAVEALKQQVEDFQNGFGDTLRLSNMQANMLQPGLASPRDPFDVCVEEIAGTTGIPIRILTTKAGGNVVGHEDKASWNSLVHDRQDHECSVYLSRALTIMSEAGLLDFPEDAEIEWEPVSALTETDEAEIMDKKSSAFQKTIAALSTLKGTELDAKEIMEQIGFKDIEFDLEDLDDGEIDDPEVDEEGNPIDEDPQAPSTDEE